MVNQSHDFFLPHPTTGKMTNVGSQLAYMLAIFSTDDENEVIRLAVKMHYLIEEGNAGTHLEGNVSKEVLRKEGEILGEMFLEMKRKFKKKGLGSS